MKKILSLALVLLLIIPVSGCQSGRKLYSAEFLGLFDTVTQMVGYADSQEAFTAFAQQLKDDLTEYNNLYDIYNSYEGLNNIKTINDSAGIAPVKVDRRIIDLLLYSKEQYLQMGGVFDIALGSVLSIWHDYRKAGTDDPDSAALPPMDALQAAAKHADISSIIIDEAASTVYIADPLTRIDVGAVAKGYATEQVCLAAEERGYTSFLLSVGGNVRAVGSKDGRGEKWTIGVRDPDSDDPNSSLLVTALTDESVVTSGIYERYYTVNGVRYHHIIDPKTLMPANYFEAVTIVCPDSGLADVLSTAIFCMPYEEGAKLIAALPGTEALWILPGGTIKQSAHFSDFVKNK